MVFQASVSRSLRRGLFFGAPTVVSFLVLMLAPGCFPVTDDSGGDAGRADASSRDGGIADGSVNDAGAPPPGCGDGEINGSEVCDTALPVTLTCQAVGAGEGPLACKSDCLSFDTSSCQTACTPPNCPDSGPPVVEQLTATPSTLTPSTQVLIQAVVTDPDGAADLRGGTLQTGAGVHLANFLAGVGARRFERSLSWAEFSSVAPPDFLPGKGRQSLAAAFTDNAGGVGRKTLQITLACDDPARAACSGTCTDLLTSQSNCGACGVSIPSRGFCDAGIPSCDAGQDNCSGTCKSLSRVANCGACGHDCNTLPNYNGAAYTSWINGSECRPGGVCAFDIAMYQYQPGQNCNTICADQQLRCDPTVVGDFVYCSSTIGCVWFSGSSSSFGTSINSCTQNIPPASTGGRPFSAAFCQCTD